MEAAVSERPHVKSQDGRPRCPVCAGSLAKGKMCTFRPRVGTRPARLLACSRCECMSILTAEARAGDYFEQTGYVHPGRERLWLWHKEGMFAWLMRRANAYFPPGHGPRRMLDFGCSYGHLARRFRADRWQCIGVDVSRSILEFHRRRGEFHVFPSLDSPDIPAENVQVITMIDVLCYLDDPVGTLRTAWRKLSRPGVVMVRLPNRTRLLRIAAGLLEGLGVDIVRRLVCDHNHHWSPRTVEVAGRRAGFDETRIIHRERGYRHRWPASTIHWLAASADQATRGAAGTSLVFHAELWKGTPPENVAH